MGAATPQLQPQPAAAAAGGRGDGDAASSAARAPSALPPTRPSARCGSRPSARSRRAGGRTRRVRTTAAATWMRSVLCRLVSRLAGRRRRGGEQRVRAGRAGRGAGEERLPGRPLLQRGPRRARRGGRAGGGDRRHRGRLCLGGAWGSGYRELERGFGGRVPCVQLGGASRQTIGRRACFWCAAGSFGIAPQHGCRAAQGPPAAPPRRWRRRRLPVSLRGRVCQRRSLAGAGRVDVIACVVSIQLHHLHDLFLSMPGPCGLLFTLEPSELWMPFTGPSVFAPQRDARAPLRHNALASQYPTRKRYREDYSATPSSARRLLKRRR